MMELNMECTTIGLYRVYGAVALLQSLGIKD